MKQESHDVAIYGGYIIDDEKLCGSASGGIAAAISEKFIDEGGYVAGVAYSKDFYHAEYQITNEKRELKKFRGSKYFEVDKKDIYQKVRALLHDNQKVLFIGLPCDVAGLYSFLGEKPEKLLTCELVCNGPTSLKVHREYILYLEKKYHSKVIDFSTRFKQNKSWVPMCLYAKFENGKEFCKPFFQTEYGYAFSILGREACYHCRLKGDNRCADIMIGDFWGATEQDAFWNPKGVSVIFAETEKGNEELLKLETVKLFPTSFERAVAHNPMVIKPKQRSCQRDEFSKWFTDKGLIRSAKHMKFIRFAIMKHMPQNIYNMVEKVYVSIRR